VVTGLAPAGVRYRTPVLIGSLLLLVSGFLPWWHTGGDRVGGVLLPTATGLGLTGPGIAAFVAAIVCLAVLDVGYLRGRWGFALDTPLLYLGAGLVGAAAVLIRLWQLWTVDYLPIPADSPGLVLAAVGVGFILYGAGTGLSSRPSP